MTRNRLILVATAVASLAQAALSIGATPCTDCPTPPPCSAEGACYPKQDTWGSYRTQWSRWPGDYDADAAPAGERSVLPQTIIPKPIEEDRAAPAPSAPEEPAPRESELGRGARDLDLPSLPPIPGPPGMQPPAGNAPAQPPGNYFDNNLPPGLPPLPDFDLPPGIGPPQSGVPGPASRPQLPAVREADGPPALPAGFASLIGARPAVSQASHTHAAGASGARPAATVTPAYYSTGR